MSKAGTSKSAAEARRKKFIEAYIANGGNGTDAAKAAGFSAKTAHVQASHLLKDPKVSSEITKRRDGLAKKYELTSDSVIAELSKIVHADPRKVFDANGNLLPVSEWPDEMAGAIASVEIEEMHEGRGDDRRFIGYSKKVKLWDKNSAIEKAMKHLGLFERDNKQKPATVVLAQLLSELDGTDTGLPGSGKD